MKLQTIKKLTAFIMTFMMFSVFPGMLDAQKPCNNGECPVGKVCIDNHCVKIPVFCNCYIRPIPPECGQICGWYTDPNNGDIFISMTDGSKFGIDVNLEEAENASFKIYDVTGKVIKTIAHTESAEAEHQFEWDKTDSDGNLVSRGLYILQLDTAPGYMAQRKLVAVN